MLSICVKVSFRVAIIVRVKIFIQHLRLGGSIRGNLPDRTVKHFIKLLKQNTGQIHMCMAMVE